MTLEYENNKIPYDYNFYLILIFKPCLPPPLPPLSRAARPRRLDLFLGRADQRGRWLAGYRVHRRPFVTTRMCRTRCARSAEQRDRQRSVLPWSRVAGHDRRSGTAATGRAARGMRRRPALIMWVRRGREDTRRGVEDARIDNVIIINSVTKYCLG